MKIHCYILNAIQILLTLVEKNIKELQYKTGDYLIPRKFKQVQCLT